MSSSSDVLKNLANTVNKASSYYLEGSMEIMNNDDTYTYSVKVSYKKDNYYKVELTNTSNDHEQVILRNEDGVYVQTHKSTK
jgi:outer membrane lipoprotein-sorting protein